MRQAAALAACLEDHRQLYNAALEHRRTAYRKAGVTVRYGDQSADLKHIRSDDAEGQGRWSFSSQQATLRRLDKAFRAFFTRVREGRTPGFPRFKGRGWFDTAEWPKDGDGCRWDAQPEHPTATFIRLQGIGHVRVHQHRPVRGRVKTISVKREGARWYVVLSCDDVPAQPLPSIGAAVGVDMGVASLVAESAGREVIAVNPAGTSRTCARCGHCAKDNRLSQAAFACTACGHTAHADVNAAINILRAGLALRDAAEAA
ncbi:transposase [Microbispora sp. NEAU-D428]|uniref:RNA-guided endonuclease InsQ/TnpB family protein n=1 Tax=Microbispora sitophila TaxID=2771537 RepID=UPI00186928FB|nr:zinc ribbon domain-containing protein [Microbispora sitophila]MBE3013339.1 transposase [Microbispora sitophila]